MSALQLSIQNDVNELPRITSEVTSYLDAHAVKGTSAFTVHLVVEELVRNVQRHAYGDERPDGIIDMTIEARDDGVHIHVKDDGPPFDLTTPTDPDTHAPLNERTPGGLGIFLVREMCENVAYERAGERNRVRVRVAISQ